MKLLEITSFTEFKKIIEEEKLFFINITATWCKPCQLIKKDLEIFVKEQDHESVFIKLDYDLYDEENDDFNQYFTIDKIPTFICFKDGIIKNKIISSNLEIIIDFVNQNLKNEEYNHEINEDF
tara:strand:- start:770 stop:1138 length:369 start_codon:yes stop_codon:yes gene_type:complete